MAAIAGTNPWCSPSDAYLILRGEVEDHAGNEATDAGSRLEAFVLDWCECEIGTEIERDIFIEDGPLCASVDGFAGDDAIVEAKTTGIVGLADSGFDPTYDDDRGLPDRVNVQVSHYLGVTGRAKAYVPVLIGGKGFHLFTVERNEKLIDALRDMAMDFMEKHVRLGIQPTGFAPSIEVLKRIRRDPGKVVEIPREDLEAYIVARAAESQAKQDAEDAYARLLALAGNGDGLSVDGKLVATYLETKRKGYTVEPTIYRQLRLIKSKGARQ